MSKAAGIYPNGEGWCTSCDRAARQTLSAALPGSRAERRKNCGALVALGLRFVQNCATPPVQWQLDEHRPPLRRPIKSHHVSCPPRSEPEPRPAHYATSRVRFVRNANNLSFSHSLVCLRQMAARHHEIFSPARPVKLARTLRVIWWGSGAVDRHSCRGLAEGRNTTSHGV